MDIWKTLTNAVTGRSKYKKWHKLKDAGEQSDGIQTRQRFRHAAQAPAFQAVSSANPTMPRKDRRKLARAFAAKTAREQMRGKVAA